MGVSVVIPARLESTRFPRKILAEIGGKPILRHVLEKVAQAERVDSVFVATDSDEVRELVEAWDGQVLMTRASCSNGTERIASILDSIPGEFIINVQADEPMLDPALVGELSKRWHESSAEIVTPIYRLHSTEQLVSPHVVKVAVSATGQAIFFSRSPIPHIRDVAIDHWLRRNTFWGHVGVYGFGRETLARYESLPIGDLERVERLEQLRFLEAGLRIDTVEAKQPSIGVDTPEDLERVREMFKET